MTTDAAQAKEEFWSQPVPLRQRLGFVEPALIWAGFGVAFICAVIGGIIQQGLGTVQAILAILVGNSVLFLYSSAIAYGSGKWGLSFPLTVRQVFGRVGARVPVLILALLVTGWYAFQAWLSADVLRVAFDLSAGGAAVGVAAVVFGVLYAIPVIFGIKQMVLVRKFAVPGMIIFALYYIFARIIPAGSRIFAEPGSGDMPFMLGVGLAWSTFVVSGTMTGDIVRYAKTGLQAVGVTVVAFLLSNSTFMILGALISATVDNPEVVYFFDQRTAAVVLPLAFLAILSNWSTCDACLYNAAHGFANSLPRFNWKRAATLGMIIGLVAAGTGIISNIVNWLILLGLLVPPIGGAIIADYYFVRGSQGFAFSRETPVNWGGIVAMLAGVGAGYYTYVNYPDLLFGVAGIAVSFVIYLVLAKVAPAAVGAELSTTPTGAEAIGTDLGGFILEET